MIILGNRYAQILSIVNQSITLRKEVKTMSREGSSGAQIDNWTHRSACMVCGKCMFFVLKTTIAIQREDHIIGRCRANPPTMKGWPVVFSDDWCGGHKLDETKLN